MGGRGNTWALAATVVAVTAQAAAPAQAGSWHPPHTAFRGVSPTVAMSSQGHLAVAFYNGKRYVVARARPGRRLGRPQPIPGRPAAFGDLPKLAVDDRGAVVIAWLDSSLAQKETDDEELCCDVVRVSTAAPRRRPTRARQMTAGRSDASTSSAPAVAIGPGGRAAIRYDGACGPVLRSARAGRRFGRPIRVTPPGASCDPQAPRPPCWRTVTCSWPTRGGRRSVARLGSSAFG